MTEANKSRKILFLPLKFNFAKANAAKLDVNVPTIVTDNATIKLFDIPDNSGPMLQISVYLLNEISVGIHTGGSANTSSFDFSDVDTIQSSGAIMTTAPMDRKIKMKKSVIRSFFFTDIVSTFSFFRERANCMVILLSYTRIAQSRSNDDFSFIRNWSNVTMKMKSPRTSAIAEA